MKPRTATTKLTTTLTALLAGAMLLAQAPVQALPLTDPGPDAAQLIGSPGFPGSDLYEVSFIAIDGQMIVGDRDWLWIEPGSYEITVRMKVIDPQGLGFRRPERRETEGYNTIEIDAEAGRTYHILGRYDASNRPATYSTILHEVTDTP
ncbi:hypothetical protein HFP89_08515 [Wenzhouxiangella sp. XN79A]|uniref:hypothetical protein n=1 Tax=Wenzhouxiangella sp. XN79A TaxID=2724193 RepID=UPI00144ADBDE|nr:hypothetical protein [Wenzhouxiangella sp. XN79A]NKI35208.1 hypothetical protein [Wenzhouxiangella sp. XN79A]